MLQLQWYMLSIPELFYLDHGSISYVEQKWEQKTLLLDHLVGTKYVLFGMWYADKNVIKDIVKTSWYTVKTGLIVSKRSLNYMDLDGVSGQVLLNFSNFLH